MFLNYIMFFFALDHGAVVRSFSFSFLPSPSGPMKVLCLEDMYQLSQHPFNGSMFRFFWLVQSQVIVVLFYSYCKVVQFIGLLCSFKLYTVVLYTTRINILTFLVVLTNWMKVLIFIHRKRLGLCQNDCGIDVLKFSTYAPRFCTTVT